MEQAIGTRIGASSWRGNEPSSSECMLDCFVVPPRNDGKVGSSCLLDCFVVPPRNDGKGSTNPAPSLRSEAEAIQKRGANEKYEQMDHFVVLPRKEGKVDSSWRGTKPSSSECTLNCFVVPPRNDGKGSSNPAPSLRSEAEAIQKKGANEEYEQLDCFVVPPRNDGKGAREEQEDWIAS